MPAGIQMPTSPPAAQQNGVFFCPQCGYHLSSDMLFCEKCGSRVR
jgi:hypothetical protein